MFCVSLFPLTHRTDYPLWVSPMYWILCIVYIYANWQSSLSSNSFTWVIKCYILCFISIMNFVIFSEHLYKVYIILSPVGKSLRICFPSPITEYLVQGSLATYSVTALIFHIPLISVMCASTLSVLNSL